VEKMDMCAIVELGVLGAHLKKKREKRERERERERERLKKRKKNDSPWSL